MYQFKRSITLYGSNAIQELANKYIEKGGEVVTLQEGCLGWGLTVMYGAGLKTAVIKERALNEWQSAHAVRFYNEMPEKYSVMIDAM